MLPAAAEANHRPRDQLLKIMSGSFWNREVSPTANVLLVPSVIAASLIGLSR